MSNQWDKALQNLTADIQGGRHDGESLSQEYHRVKAKIAEWIVPLLNAVDDSTKYMLDTPEKLKLREELTKWQTK